jgi:hypothetical protein
VMGNRSDRRLANLSNCRALEAVGPMRTSRADFHQGPERHNQLHTEAEYTTATGSHFTSTDDLALGAGSIYKSSTTLRLADRRGSLGRTLPAMHFRQKARCR